MRERGLVGVVVAGCALVGCSALLGLEDRYDQRAGTSGNDDLSDIVDTPRQDAGVVGNDAAAVTSDAGPIGPVADLVHALGHGGAVAVDRTRTPEVVYVADESARQVWRLGAAAEFVDAGAAPAGLSIYKNAAYYGVGTAVMQWNATGASVFGDFGGTRTRVASVSMKDDAINAFANVAIDNLLGSVASNGTAAIIGAAMPQQNPGQLARSSEFLFWTTDGAAGQRIVRGCVLGSCGGSTYASLAATHTAVRGLAWLEGAGLAVNDDTGLYVMPVSAGPATDPATRQFAHPAGATGGPVAADGTTAYYAMHQGANVSIVRATATATTTLVTMAGSCASISAGADYVYFTSNAASGAGALYRIAK